MAEWSGKFAELAQEAQQLLREWHLTDPSLQRDTVETRRDAERFLRMGLPRLSPEEITEQANVLWEMIVGSGQLESSRFTQLLTQPSTHLVAGLVSEERKRRKKEDAAVNGASVSRR